MPHSSQVHQTKCVHEDGAELECLLSCCHVRGTYLAPHCAPTITIWKTPRRQSGKVWTARRLEMKGTSYYCWSHILPCQMPAGVMDLQCTLRCIAASGCTMQCNVHNVHYIVLYTVLYCTVLESSFLGLVGHCCTATSSCTMQCNAHSIMWCTVCTLHWTAASGCTMKCTHRTLPSTAASGEDGLYYPSQQWSW